MKYLTSLLLTAALLSLSYSALASPVNNGSNFKADITQESLEELNDLNEQSEDSANIAAAESEENSPEESSFSHHDEDLPRNQVNMEMVQSLKYEVEILESPDIKKENNEVEEQFRGAAIKMNTDTFVAENIEVSGGNDNSTEAMPQGHMALTIILVIVALVSIGLYAVLVIWRAHLEQRYGMRELLVTNDIDDDFGPQRNDNSRGTATTGADSNNRHFILGQA